MKSAGMGSELEIRLRADLEIVARNEPTGFFSKSEQKKWWIYHPINGSVVRLHDEDYRLLRNGQITQQDPLFDQALKNGLIAGAPTLTRSSTRAWWTNPLYIRLPGVSAQNFARLLARNTGFLFSYPAVVLWSMFIALTAAFLLTRLDSIWQSVGFLAAFQAQHWMWAIVVLAVTKFLHECGHAAVCQRMGAECRQIGAILICGTPCLYCDVSDSWRVASRIHRAAIMLAGIYVEWILSAIAAWVWMTNDDGATRMIAFHIMIVCGVSTFIFNINPLMRYDGYFVLSDLCNVTNLRTLAAEAWQHVVIGNLAGKGYRTTATFSLRAIKTHLFVFYHFFSLVYRYVVFAGLAGWFYIVLSQAGIEPLGRAVVVVAVLIMLAQHVKSAVRMLQAKGNWQNVPLLRRSILLATSLSIVTAMLFVPFERRITARGTVELTDAGVVYVPATAMVDEVHVDFGNHVVAGQPLVRLASSELQFERPDLLVQINKLELHCESLRSRAISEPELLDLIDDNEALLSAAKTRLNHLDRQLAELRLCAPIDGMVTRPAVNDLTTTVSLDSLKARTGSAVGLGDIWCLIGNERLKHVHLVLNARERAQIKIGSRVKICVPQAAGRDDIGLVECTVGNISQIHSMGASGSEMLEDSFQVSCRLPEDFANRVNMGATATAVFKGHRVRLASVIYDRLIGFGT